MFFGALLILPKLSPQTGYDRLRGCCCFSLGAEYVGGGEGARCCAKFFRSRRLSLSGGEVRQAEILVGPCPAEVRPSCFFFLFCVEELLKKLFRQHYVLGVVFNPSFCCSGSGAGQATQVALMDSRLGIVAAGANFWAQLIVTVLVGAGSSVGHETVLQEAMGKITVVCLKVCC